MDNPSSPAPHSFSLHPPRSPTPPPGRSAHPLDLDDLTTLPATIGNPDGRRHRPSAPTTPAPPTARAPPLSLPPAASLHRQRPRHPPHRHGDDLPRHPSTSTTSTPTHRPSAAPSPYTVRRSYATTSTTAPRTRHYRQPGRAAASTLGPDDDRAANAPRLYGVTPRAATIGNAPGIRRAATAATSSAIRDLDDLDPDAPPILRPSPYTVRRSSATTSTTPRRAPTIGNPRTGGGIGTRPRRRPRRQRSAPLRCHTLLRHHRQRPRQLAPAMFARTKKPGRGARRVSANLDDERATMPPFIFRRAPAPPQCSLPVVNCTPKPFDESPSRRETPPKSKPPSTRESLYVEMFAFLLLETKPLSREKNGTLAQTCYSPPGLGRTYPPPPSQRYGMDRGNVIPFLSPAFVPVAG